MKELFYFSFADLMARIEYHQAANALRYETHRNMTFYERVTVERYLLTDFAMKTDYYKRHPALFVYLGTDEQLLEVLEAFHSNTLMGDTKKKEVKATIANLINRSMQNYYFEQIGDTILQTRREAAQGAAGFTGRRMKLEELVKAYNCFAEHKIAIAEIVPDELKSYFELPPESEYSRTPYTVNG